jgi:hypothetical protein
VVVFVYHEHDIQVSPNFLYDLKNGTDYTYIPPVGDSAKHFHPDRPNGPRSEPAPVPKLPDVRPLFTSAQLQ